MLNSELKQLVEDRMIASMTKRSREIISDAFDGLSREYLEAAPLTASIFAVTATWVREEGPEGAHTHLGKLTIALNHGNFSEVDDVLRAVQIADRYRRAKSDDRLLALRWSAWLSYEVRNAYKVLGRALYGMEAA